MHVKTAKWYKTLAVDFMMLLFFYLIVMLVFQNNELSGFVSEVPHVKVLLNVNTIFLGIVLEAFPFILIGSVISAVIQTFISDKAIRKFLPAHPLAAIIPAILLAFLIPVCECAIIPVMRRLMNKGLPQHLGMVFIAAAPVLNPITVLSTTLAFRSNEGILAARLGMGFVVALLVGVFIYYFYRNQSQLNQSGEFHHHHHHGDSSMRPSKWRQVINHTSDDFFDTGKYVILGAFLAAMFQTLFNQNTLKLIESNASSSTLVMMIFGFLISLCSQADAFVAASFAGKFTSGSVAAFLVFGPILDLKTTLMLFAHFRTKFVMVFICIVFISVFLLSLILQKFYF